MIILVDEIAFAVMPVSPAPVAVNVMVIGVLAVITVVLLPVSVQVATPLANVATATIEAPLLVQVNVTVEATPVREIALPYVHARVVAMSALAQSVVMPLLEATDVIVPAMALPEPARLTVTTMADVLPYAAATTDELKLYTADPIVMLGIAFTV